MKFDKHPATLQWRELLEIGFPKEYLALEARRSIYAIRALPSDINGRDDSIHALEKFIKKMESK